MADKTEGKKRKRGSGKPFVKGYDPRRNYNGRPRGSVSITTKIKQMLLEVSPDKKRTILEELVDKIFNKAIKDGNEQIIKLIWEYVDGKPKERVELEAEVETRDRGYLVDLLQKVDDKTRRQFFEIVKKLQG